MPCEHKKQNFCFSGDGESYIKCTGCRKKFFSDMTHYQHNEMLHKRIEKLEKTVKVLLEKLDEVYYAPEMPGFVKTRIDFENSRHKPTAFAKLPQGQE